MLWPDGRKSDDGLADEGSRNEGVDKSYIASAVDGRPVDEGETLGGSGTFDTKLPRGRPGHDREPEALDSELTDRQDKAEQGLSCCGAR